MITLQKDKIYTSNNRSFQVYLQKIIHIKY